MAAMGLLEESYRLPLVPPIAGGAREGHARAAAAQDARARAARRVADDCRDSRSRVRWIRSIPSRSPAVSSTSIPRPDVKARPASGWPRSCATAAIEVTEQPVADGRFNVYAQLGTPPSIVFSTHFDCVPPFFPSREERGLVFGRGACDAKGILAAQVAAAERLRAAGETRVALLFVVGEERGSDGAHVANEQAPAGVRFLINGEPTDNRLGAATRGLLRVRLHANGRAAHSSFPELGESAIDKLLDALMVIRGVALPDDPLLGRTHYTVGLIEGGVAPNVVSPHASAELLFRTVERGRPKCATRLRVVEGLVGDRARARRPGGAHAHVVRVRNRGLSVHDRRPAAARIGARRSSSGRDRSTSRTPTTSTCRSTSFMRPSISTNRSGRVCSRRRRSPASRR